MFKMNKWLQLIAIRWMLEYLLTCKFPSFWGIKEVKESLNIECSSIYMSEAWPLDHLSNMNCRPYSSLMTYCLQLTAVIIYVWEKNSNSVLLKVRLSAKCRVQSPWDFFPLKRSAFTKARFFELCVFFFF